MVDFINIQLFWKQTYLQNTAVNLNFVTPHINSPCIFFCMPYSLELNLCTLPSSSACKESICNAEVTHPSILIWRIPWTEELGRLQFMGLQSRT